MQQSPRDLEKSLDFDAATLPWVDRADFPERLASRRAAGEVSAEEAERLETWHRDGFLTLRKAIAPETVDRLLAAVEAAWESRPPISLLVEGRGVTPFAEVPPREELTHHHYRLLDFQDVSEAARDVMLNPTVVRHLELIFGEPPVAMQSLFFEYGSEQATHQDFPYVQSQVLSHLVGCWVACDEVDDANGPLFYYRGSHRIPKFVFGGGALAYGGDDEAEVAAFEAHLEEQCRALGLERLTLSAEKGDVLFWHAALVHGGSPVRDRERTRRSLVFHCSTRTAYPRDRRWPHERPEVIERNGGALYLRRRPGTVRRLRELAKAVLRRGRDSTSDS